MSLFQEQSKSKKLEDGMRKVDEEMKRTDVLLNQMIPKVVADKLRQGESAMSTCQVAPCSKFKSKDFCAIVIKGWVLLL